MELYVCTYNVDSYFVNILYLMYCLILGLFVAKNRISFIIFVFIIGMSAGFYMFDIETKAAKFFNIPQIRQIHDLCVIS